MAGVAVGAIVSVASTLYSNSESKKAAREAKEEGEAMARLNAMNVADETAEMVRRQERESAQTEATARAKAAASGVDLDEGSGSLFLKDMGEEHQRQIDWTKRSGLSQQNLLIKGAESQGKIIDAQQKAQSNAAWANVAGTAVQTGVGWGTNTTGGWYTKED